MSRVMKCYECNLEFDATDRAYQAQGSDELLCSELCARRHDGLKGPHTNVPLEELPRAGPIDERLRVEIRHWPAEEAYPIGELP